MGNWREKTMFALILVFICVFAGAVGQILMKKGMTEIGEIKGLKELAVSLPNMFSNKFVFIGLILYALSFVLWLGALSLLDVSLMYPLLSLGYVITAVFAYIFLKENISIIRACGIVTVVIGVFLIMRS